MKIPMEKSCTLGAAAATFLTGLALEAGVGAAFEAGLAPKLT